MNTNKPKHQRKSIIREVKREIRIVGIDDGMFTPHSEAMVDVIGVVFRGGYWLDGFMHTKVTVDGMDATEKLVQMVTSSPHHKQLRVIMLNGVTMAGFNVVDIDGLHTRTKIPVIAVTRDKPDFKEIREALRHLPDTSRRLRVIARAGKIMRVQTRENAEPIYAHTVGLNEETARRILRTTSTRSNIPEPLRVAHIIASGLGQSWKRIHTCRSATCCGKSLKDATLRMNASLKK